MQSDCEVYVDPEEDEVFFGSVTDKEKSLCAKIETRSGHENECNLVLSPVFVNKNHCEEKNVENLNRQLVSEDVKLNLVNKDMENSLNDSYKSCENVQDSNKKSSNNSVELEHNYSTSMKEKIDKTILATPKSIVKADRDGGFLKVLSEIALVKAEVDACKEIVEKEKDDDKENKIVPEINIIEATPEKLKLSPSPPASINFQQRKPLCICSTPKIGDSQKLQNSKFTNSNCKNFKAIENNHCINSSPGEVKAAGDSNRISQNQSINLIEFDESTKEFDPKEVCCSFSEKLNEVKTKEFEMTSHNYLVDQSETKHGLLEEIFNTSNSAEVASEKNKSASLPADAIDLHEKHKKSTGYPDFTAEEAGDSGQQLFNTSKLAAGMNDSLKEKAKYENNYSTLTTSKNLQMQGNSQRFSKEAKEIIEVIKKSAINDTLNFTVQELDVENIENSFLSPQADSFLDDTIMAEKEKKTPAPESAKKVQKVENSNITLMLSQSKFQSQKCFSEKKVNSHIQTPSEKCIKKSAEEIDAIPCTENIKERKGKEKENNLLLSSRIPVFGLKTSKLQGREHFQSSAKTPRKTPAGKIFKNPKFDNIESPISAYIHNKPTSLILNVKTECKKENVEKVWKNQKSWSEKKANDKPAFGAPLKSASRLPFVEYKSGATYEIEKRAESRLPRLAPSFQKLIGVRSPKVLKHQGRFYVKTPRRSGLGDDCTVVAEPNEVSLVVSQDAGKSSKKTTF